MPRGGGIRGVRLDFPHFNGDNPTIWCFKADQSFAYHQNVPTHKLLMASYHLQGKVMIWYQDALDSGVFNSWDNFYWALQV